VNTLPSNVRDLARRPVVGQFVRYAMVGAANLSVYLAILNGLRALGTPFAGALAVAFVASSVQGFLLNKHWTFKDRRDKAVRQYAKFLVFTAIGLGISEGLSHLLLVELSRFGRVGENISALGPLPVTVLWNFTAYRLWTFKPSPPDGGSFGPATAAPQPRASAAS
jgi:putative flippase GtrA